MAEFTFTAPNGKKYKVSGDTKEGALAALQKMLGEGAGNASPSKPAPDYGPPMPEKPKGTAWEDWTQYPADASPETDIPIGKDESGETVWQTRLGHKYVRTKTVSVPSTKKWSDVTAGDVAGSVGHLVAGIGSTIKAGVTAPGRALAGEPVTLGDAMSTATLAVPDLVPTAKGVTLDAASTQLGKDVAAAKKLDIPVYRTDVKPPTTFIGKNVQKVGESIPFVGTGATRAAQSQARIEAAQNLVREYGADAIIPAIDDVAASVLEKRNADLTKYTAQKTEVIDRLSTQPVPTPNAIAAIDEQIAKLKAQNLPELKPVIAKLEGWKGGLAGQTLKGLEQNRAIIGDAFKSPELASVRGAGEKALSAIYGPLREDMGNFIKATGEPTDFVKWKSANARLSAMMDELKDAALKRVLQKGEATPEVVKSMLFSQKPSDMARLYRSLTPEGQARARTAILQEALGKSGGTLENLSPERLISSLQRLDPQIRTFFSGNDLEAVNGLSRALQLTRHASEAIVSPKNGMSVLPTGIALLASHLTGGSAPAAVGIMGAAGVAARIYEATGVQRALRAVARAESQSAQTTSLKMLDAALGKAGYTVPAVEAATANENAGPYDRLYQRYGK